MNRALALLIVLVVTSVPTASDALRGGEVEKIGFSGVVEVYMGGKSCTGSMIAPNVVLTAAHCFDHIGADKASRGTEEFMIFYNDPSRGRRRVFEGKATWKVPTSYRPRKSGTAGAANADHGVVIITQSVSESDDFTGTEFAGTDYHDYLRLYSDERKHLTGRLQAYGAGLYTYSGKSDDKLRTKWLEVENVEYEHIVVDMRKGVSICAGDSGGPLIYFAGAPGGNIATIAGVLAREQGTEGADVDARIFCASNNLGEDNAYYSRVSWDVIRFIEAQTGISCPVQTGADKKYVRCFDLPFIEDVEAEGLPLGRAVAIAVSAID